MILVRRTFLVLLTLAALPGMAAAQWGPPPGPREPRHGHPSQPPQSPPYYESGVAWRQGQGCWTWGGIGLGWGDKVEDLACKYCGDGRALMSGRGPMWRGDKCFNRFNGWKELLEDVSCRYSRPAGGCAFLGDYDEDAPFQGIGHDPYPYSGAGIRNGGKCWNHHNGWKELLEDDACRYCGGNAWGRNVGPQIRKGQGCWNWNGRSWDGQLSDVACKYHGCMGSGRASNAVGPALERTAATMDLGDAALRSFVQRALATE